MEERLRYVNPEALHQPTGYTHVVEVQPGRIAYISGQVAFNRDGDLVGDGDIVAQARQVFENLKDALEALNVTFADVVKLTYYALDAARLSEIREVRNQYISNPPSSTFVVVKGLARPEFLIEVEAVVALP